MQTFDASYADRYSYKHTKSIYISHMWHYFVVHLITKIGLLWEVTSERSRTKGLPHDPVGRSSDLQETKVF